MPNLLLLLLMVLTLVRCGLGGKASVDDWSYERWRRQFMSKY